MYKQYRWSCMYLCKFWHDREHCRKIYFSIL